MSNDLWRTPPWLFNWLSDLYGPFDIDLAADDRNHLCDRWFTIQNNALLCSWHEHSRNGFCNPPYSNLTPWLFKANAISTASGFSSTWVLPVWNGEKYWLESVFQKAASEIRLIFGRVAFIDCDGTEAKGNRGGTIIVHYNDQLIFPPDNPRIFYEDRDLLIDRYT